MSGLDSFPVRPLILGYFFAPLCITRPSPPSMWSKERFSIIRTTMCLRLSNPVGGIYPSQVPMQNSPNSYEVVRLRAKRFADRGLGRRGAKSLVYQLARSDEHTSELQSHLNLLC